MSVKEPPAQDQQFTAIYSNHHQWLYRWLYSKLGCSYQAADLAHDTFIRLLAKEQAATELREPRAFLTTVAKGLLVNYWRRLSVERAYLDVIASQPELTEPSVEERQIIIETLLEIDQLLDGLPAQTRSIFLLSQLDGLTYPHIAAQLSLTVNQVQKAMIKAVRCCYQALYGAG